MHRSIPFLLCGLILIATGTAGATDLPALSRGGRDVIHGRAVDCVEAARDTYLVLGPWGSGADFNGQFQDLGGVPAALNDPADHNSWTSVDLTTHPASVWHADGYRAISGLVSAWCGELGFPPCSASDLEGGYGNNYIELLDWTVAVPAPAAYAAIHLSALVQYDVETGYDYVSLQCLKRDQGAEVLWVRDGKAAGETVSVDCLYLPEDYLGDGADEVTLRWRVTSDGVYSDADCLYPSNGALRVDDIGVTLVNDGATVSTFDDFEDGSLGAFWTPVAAPSVGDFAKIWTGLEDIDACSTNYSPQLAFIDDGVVVPGTGGSPCLNWCYGPGGYIVTTTGGLAGPDYHLHNVVESPVMPWPASDLDYCRLDFDVYRHEDLSVDSPGNFYIWGVRSTASGDPADIQSEPWRNRNYVYYGEGYFRSQDEITDLLLPRRQYVQVQLGVWELGYLWGWVQDDGTPAPYFDNVRLSAAPFAGPSMTASVRELANDGFPASGTVDMGDPGALSVRFDMAANVASGDDPGIDPGDSLVVQIVAVRAGASIEPGSVRMHYVLNPNSAFDAHRSSGLPNTGSVTGVPAARGGVVSQDRWAFDLPDSGFLFPGDELHYYFEAADNALGDIRFARLPADLTGYGDFSNIQIYDPDFTVRGLPDLRGDGSHPPALFWNDYGDRGGRDEWHSAFSFCHLQPGYGYDTYYTHAPSSDLDNGLGGRATVAQLAGYDYLVYASGDLYSSTLVAEDLDLLAAWLDLGGKGLILSGDGVASDIWLDSGRPEFLAERMGVAVVASDIRPYIGNQASPLAKPVPGNPYVHSPDEWRIYGGCGITNMRINDFDAVTNVGAGQRIAEFADPSGHIGAYFYSALTLRLDAGNGARVFSLPYDLMYVWDFPGADKNVAPAPARAVILNNLLSSLGLFLPYWDMSDAPDAKAAFSVAGHPNPFNPVTRIEYAVPGPCRLTVKVYDLHGAHVRTLLDGPVQDSGFVVWDGTDQGGGQVASGLYFYEARTPNEVRTGKLTLLK